MLGQKSHAGSNACMEEMVSDKSTGIWQWLVSFTVSPLAHFSLMSQPLKSDLCSYHFRCSPQGTGGLLISKSNGHFPGLVLPDLPAVYMLMPSLSYLQPCTTQLTLTSHLPVISSSACLKLHSVSSPSVMLFLGSLSLLISFSHPSLGIIFMISVDF